MIAAQQQSPAVENYFNYFTEIEQRFCRRRGTILQVSTLDWALMETWKDSGVPLEAVLRGIDETFDKYDRRPKSPRKVNGLGYCTQAVLTAAEDMKEAAVGATSTAAEAAAGLSPTELAQFFRQNARQLRQAQSAAQVRTVAEECAATLSGLAEALEAGSPQGRLEDLERHMTVLEEKLMAALTMNAPQNDLIALRAQADREIAPYRSKMPAAQIEQLMKQFVHRHLLEQARIPRLSLFYM